MLGPLQVSLRPIAFRGTAPFKTVHDPAEKPRPPLNVNAWRAPLPSLLSNILPSAPSPASLGIFAALSFSTSCYSYSTLVLTKLPPTCTFTGLLFPTQISSCLLDINRSPKPSLPNKPWRPHRTSPPHIQSPSPKAQPSNPLSPPGHLLLSWFRSPSFLTWVMTTAATTTTTTSSGDVWVRTLWDTMWRAEC